MRVKATTPMRIHGDRGFLDVPPEGVEVPEAMESEVRRAVAHTWGLEEDIVKPPPKKTSPTTDLEKEG